MKKKPTLECSLTYGDASAFYLFFIEYKKVGNLSFNYDCTYIMTPKTGSVKPYEIEQISVPFLSTKFVYTPRGDKFFDYTLKKICYELRDDKEQNGNIYKRIQHLKLIYLNKEGKEEVLLDTSNRKELPETIGILAGEEIIESVNVYLKDELLCGIELFTNESKIINTSYLIGTSSGPNVEDITIKDDKKIIVGLGCEANEQTGINSIYFYQAYKNQDYEFYGTLGFRLLRAKVKQNKEFNKQIKEIKNNLTEEQKLTFDICNSSDTIFFAVLDYIIS